MTTYIFLIENSVNLNKYMTVVNNLVNKLKQHQPECYISTIFYGLKDDYTIINQKVLTIKEITTKIPPAEPNFYRSFVTICNRLFMYVKAVENYNNTTVISIGSYNTLPENIRQGFGTIAVSSQRKWKYVHLTNTEDGYKLPAYMGYNLSAIYNDATIDRIYTLIDDFNQGKVEDKSIINLTV